jgi:protein phosphatase
VAGVRALRRRELFRTAVAELLHVAEIDEVGDALSDVTAATIDGALEIALRVVARSKGTPLPMTFLVVAMGRFGGAELGFASDADVMRALEICVHNANRTIFNAAHTNPQYAGMGTTLVVGVFREGRLLLGHVGDSRGYRWRDGQLMQITHDHSLLQEQIDAGLITPQQAAVSANKNLVTRAVGVEDTVELEAHAHDLQAGDLILLCSDGLCDMLDDEHIAELLRAGTTLESTTCALIDAANQAGGKDNIAVILARVSGRAGEARAWWPFKR